MRQHKLRSSADCYELEHRPSELGPLTIYSLDQDIRLEKWQNMCEEANRWYNVAMPKANLINMVNLEVLTVTAKANGKRLYIVLSSQ